MVGRLVNIEYRKIILLLLVFVLIVLKPILAIGDKSLVFDEAYLLTKEEVDIIQNKAEGLSRDYNMDIVIVTINDAQGKNSRDFADDYFDYGGFGIGSDYDGILFLLDMDNREAYISTSGIGERYLTDERIEYILDDVFDSGLSEGDYFGGLLGFLTGTERYLNRGIPSDQYIEEVVIKEKNRITRADLLISVIGSIIAAVAFYATTRSRYKMKKAKKSFSFRANSIVNFRQNEDRLVDTFVTHRVIPKANTSNSSSTSGRSTTHKSSSGRSHGGGGRKF